MKVEGRVAGRVAIVWEPDGYTVDPYEHDSCMQAFSDLKYVGEVVSQPDGVWVVTFVDCPLSNSEIVKQCADTLAGFLVEVE